MNIGTQIILASASSRRQTLLKQIGVTFEVMTVDIDETPRKHELPHHYVKRLSEEKARTAFEQSTKQRPVLGADTTVAINGMVLGKPQHQEEAIDMLMMLSGKTHQVMTAVTVLNQQCEQSIVNITEVTFANITRQQAHTYWQTGEPSDKAGAYAIQGLAAVWITNIKGSFSSVMGLPLYETAQLLRAFNIATWCVNRE